MGFAIRRSRDLGTTSPLPTGVINPFAGTTAPTGWLLCAGQEVEIASYGDLYGVLGTTYGALTNGSGGAGSSHFRVPDLRGRVPAGKDDMGGTAASRLTSTTITSGATTLGNNGGAQTHTLTSGESGVPAHQHANTATFTGSAVNSSAENSHTHANTATFTGSAVNSLGQSQTHTHTQQQHDAAAYSWTIGSGGASWGLAGTMPTGVNSVDHTHQVTAAGTVTMSNASGSSHLHSVTSAGTVAVTNVNNTAANAGSGHNNVQPTIILNYIIKV